MKNVLLIIALLFAFVIVQAQPTAHRYLRKGDKAYGSDEFTQAEENYRKALEKSQSAQGTYNLGNAIYQQERYEEAIPRYEESAQALDEGLARARAFHNLGNAYYHKNELEKSIEAYKNALRLNPNDMETKFNLAIAQRKWQQQQQEQNEDQQQDQQEQQEQEDEQQQPPPDSEEEQQQKQQQQQEGDPQDLPEQPQDLTKEEARKLLEIIAQEEQKVQQKLRKAQAKPTKSKKAW